MHLHPHHLVAAYSYLLTTPPYHKWHLAALLPHPDALIFKVSHHKGTMGLLAHYPLAISISCREVRTTDALLRTMAHEMIHLHLHLLGRADSSDHGAAFHRLALLVCRSHGWSLIDLL